VGINHISGKADVSGAVNLDGRSFW